MEKIVFRKIEAISSSYFYFYPDEQKVLLTDDGLQLVAQSHADVEFIESELLRAVSGDRIDINLLHKLDGLLSRVCTGKDDRQINFKLDVGNIG